MIDGITHKNLKLSAPQIEAAHQEDVYNIINRANNKFFTPFMVYFFNSFKTNSKSVLKSSSVLTE